MFKLDMRKFDLARAAKCYTKTQTAAKAGITYGTYLKIQSGENRLTARTLGRLAKALGVKPADLIQDED